MLKILKTNYKNLSNEKLMQAIQNGNCKAFNELWLRFNERLYYYFYRMLSNNHQTAEDFTQDLFMKIIHKSHFFDTNRNFTTWIFSIAHNMCKNEYRNQKVRTIVNNNENPDQFLYNDEIKSDHQKHINLIFKELNNLGESHKTAFLLKYREGLTIEEISKIMELPKGTVKSRLFYARKKLQQKLLPTI